MLTFQWYKSFFKSWTQLFQSQQATRRNREELHQRDSKLLSSWSDRKRHESVRNDACHGRNDTTFSIFFIVVYFLEELKKRNRHVLPSGITERRYVLCGIGVGRRKAIGNRFEAKMNIGKAAGEEAVEVGRSASEEAVVVELGVDKGYGKAFSVK